MGSKRVYERVGVGCVLNQVGLEIIFLVHWYTVT